MNTKERKLVGHGAIVSMIALVAGFGLLMSLIGGFEVLPGWILEFEIPGNRRAWARAHTGGLMNGMLMFVVALLMHTLHFPAATAGKLYWMLVGTGYANTAFYWGGLLAPNRALTIGDNRLGESNLAGVLGFLPALVFAFVLLVAMFLIARHCFRAED